LFWDIDESAKLQGALCLTTSI